MDYPNFSSRIAPSGGVSAFPVSAAAPDDVDMEGGEEWLKKQRELAQRQAEEQVAATRSNEPSSERPRNPGPTSSVAQNDVVIRPTVDKQGPMIMGGVNPGATVGSFRFRDRTRVEVRADDREAVYGPGNRFMGYRGGGGGGSQQTGVGTGRTSLPSVYDVSPEAAAREARAVAARAASDKALGEARDKFARGELQVSRGGRGQLSPQEIAAGASMEMKGQGPQGTATVQTRDGRTVTISGDQMNSKESVKAAMAPAPAASAAPTESAAPAVEAPVSVAPVSAPPASVSPVSSAAPVAAAEVSVPVTSASVPPASVSPDVTLPIVPVFPVEAPTRSGRGFQQGGAAPMRGRGIPASDRVYKVSPVPVAPISRAQAATEMKNRAAASPVNFVGASTDLPVSKVEPVKPERKPMDLTAAGLAEAVKRDRESNPGPFGGKSVWAAAGEALAGASGSTTVVSGSGHSSPRVYGKQDAGPTGLAESGPMTPTQQAELRRNARKQAKSIESRSNFAFGPVS